MAYKLFENFKVSFGTLKAFGGAAFTVFLTIYQSRQSRAIA